MKHNDRHIRWPWAAVAVALVCAFATRAEVRYVDAASGDDGHDGRTTEAAWRTLNKVNVMTFGPGDSVLFKGGQTWRGTLRPKGTGAAGSPVVFSSYGTGKPHINADGNTEAVLLGNVAHFVFEKFTVSNPAASPHRRARGIVLFAGSGRTLPGVIVRDNELTDIVGDSRQATRWLNGSIFMDSEGSGHFTELLIENNHIHDVTVRGITGNQDVTNWENPATMHANVVVRGNRIDNIGADGIRMIACRDLLVERNTVYRCGRNNMGMELNYIAACFPQQCKTTVWQHNEVAYTAHSNPPVGDEDSEAFDIDWGCAGTHVFQYNYSHDNVGGFFLFMGTIVDRDRAKVGEFEKAILRYNVSVNDGIRSPNNRIYEIHPFEGRTYKIIAYNNTFINKEEIGIHLKNAGDYSGIEFYNNVFVSPRGTYPEQQVVYDNNLYFGHAAPAYDGNAVTDDPLIDIESTAIDGMDGADVARPAEGSGAIDAGITIADNGGVDFLGNKVPAKNGPDIGAVEYADATRTRHGPSLMANRSATRHRGIEHWYLISGRRCSVRMGAGTAAMLYIPSSTQTPRSPERPGQSR